MKFLLTPIGSHGDVHPFVGLGKELHKRGHRVVMMANEYYRELIEKVGLEYVEHSTTEEFLEVLENPDVWHPKKGLALLLQYFGEHVARVYNLIEAHHEPANTVVVHSPLGFGARVAQDKFGFPAATVHLAPSGFRSTIDPPVLPQMLIPRWFPGWMFRMMYWFGDRFFIDRKAAGPINDLRASINLPPVKRIAKDWWNSPNCILGMFPKWFGQPPADWPSQLRITGFPLYDEGELSPLSDDLSSFLDAGDAPILFTPGTANAHAHAFFQAAADACQALGKRALFLTKFAAQLPSPLPDTIRHFEFVPFSLVFPRTAAVVHHGGIGTTAQALAAGVAQLIMPMGFDQPDNAHRVQRLGVGDALVPKKFNAANVAEKLRALMADSVQAKCMDLADSLAEENGIVTACDVLEELTAG